MATEATAETPVEPPAEPPREPPAEPPTSSTGPRFPISLTLPEAQTSLFVLIVLVWLAMEVGAISIVLFLFLKGGEIPDLKLLAEILLPVQSPAALIIGFYLGKSKEGKGNGKINGRDKI